MNSDFNVAVHALVYLDHIGGTLSSERLAENICTNAVRVRKVMTALGRRGLVSSTEGAAGGYALAVPAQKITLDVVADAIGGSFVSVSWRSGDTDMECLIASGMGRIMDDIYDDLDSVCREELHKKTIGSIERSIFDETASKDAC